MVVSFTPKTLDNTYSIFVNMFDEYIKKTKNFRNSRLVARKNKDLK